MTIEREHNAGMIWSTQNYGQFVLDERNRPVIVAKVGRMIAALGERNFLPNYPIVVTEEGTVLDGQHRLKAAEALGLPIYYVADGIGMSIHDVGWTTMNTKGWDIYDFLHFYASGKVEVYQKISEFLSRHPNFSLGSFLAVIRNRPIYDEFRAGQAEIADDQWQLLEGLTTLAEALKPFVPHLWAKRGFHVALRYLIENPNFRAQRLVDQFEKTGLTIYRQAEASDYLRELAKVYNFGLNKKNRVDFSR